MEKAVETPWILLIHQIPPKPDYFQVKIRRGRVPVGMRRTLDENKSEGEESCHPFEVFRLSMKGDRSKKESRR